MKKVLLTTLTACLASVSVSAQISSFDLGKQSYAYLNYSAGDGPGYEYDYASSSEFDYQYNDRIEVGVIMPLKKNFNVNLGIGSVMNYQEPELFGPFEYSVDQDGYHMKGLIVNTGLSYSLTAGKLVIIPNLSVKWCTEVNHYADSPSSNNMYVYKESYRGAWAIFEAGVDISYKNYLFGLTYTDLGNYFENVLPIGIRVGYGFTKKKKLKF